MNNVIWKYPLKPELNRIEMPKNALTLTVQIQGDQPVLWALVNPEEEQETRSFLVATTGEPIEALDPVALRLGYVATFQMDWMVFHVFDTFKFEAA